MEGVHVGQYVHLINRSSPTTLQILTIQDVQYSTTQGRVDGFRDSREEVAIADCCHFLALCDPREDQSGGSGYDAGLALLYNSSQL